MQKVDVAICSYKKPESLIYTLFSLKKHCEQYIDTVYIDDDCSDDNTVSFYQDPKLQEALLPLKLAIRINEKRCGYSKTITTAQMFRRHPIYQLAHYLFDRIRLPQFKGFIFQENDIRYQWAINSTDKKYLQVIHDDIQFNGDIVKLYLDVICSDENYAIIGDLGQCHLCHESEHCNPEDIMQGKYPSKYWPLTKGKPFNLIKPFKRNCRINEWCCMLNVPIARSIGERHKIFFGNNEHGGDSGAYWFHRVIKCGYGICDPLPTVEKRIEYYQHCWQGHSGHSVWVNQGQGVTVYSADFIKECIKQEFGYEF